MNKKRIRRYSIYLLFSVVFCGTRIVYAQEDPKPLINATLSGQVIDSLTNEPLVGATVQLQAVTHSVTTDREGRFQFVTGQKLPFTLIVSSIGYQTKIVVVRTSPVVIALSPSSEDLDEVVVVGYGTTRRRDITGSISQIKGEDMNDRPVGNIVAGIQGKAAGIDITSNTRPGGIGSIRIRGNRSINASNEPLYVVDGIPISAAEAAVLNPKDIASIEILKDASATAIYGSRGANGVILVTLVEAKQGQVTIKIDGNTSLDGIQSTTDWMNSAELLDWQRTTHITGGTYTGKYGTAPDPDFDIFTFGGGETYGQESIRKAYDWDTDGNVVLRDATAEEIANGYMEKIPVYHPDRLLNQNWTDLVTRLTTTHNHNLSMSSGSEKSSLYLSAGILDQKGAMIDQDYKRYSVTLKGDVSPRHWIKMGISTIGSYGKQNYGMADNSANSGGKDSYGQALSLMPYAPAYDENGDILNTDRNGLSAHNVLLNIANSKNEYVQYSVLANSFANITFSPWLRYQLRFGVQYTGQENGSFYGPDYTNPFSAVGTAPLIGYNNQGKRLSWVLENQLSFEKQWAAHNLKIDALQSSQENKSNGINIRAQHITFPTSLWYNLSANDDGRPMSYGTSYSRWALRSYMLRTNYALKDRYLLTATGRWDGASVLAEGNKFAFFPSLAVAWKLEEEPWLKQVSWINQFKLRYGWGTTGNSSVSPYTTTGTIAGAAYVFDETQYAGYKSSSMPNSALRWEKTQQHNIGLDFSVFSNKVSGSVEWYQANTSDLLLSRSIPPVLGYNSVLTNVGRTSNKGVEITINTRNIEKTDFSWSSSITWGRNVEKIVELTDGKVDDQGSGWYIGHPINVFRDYEYDRLWQNTDEDQRLMELYKTIGNITSLPGQVKVKDQPFIESAAGSEGSKTVVLASGEQVTYLDNGFGTINDDDKVILGSNRPRWQGGIVNSFRYKNFDFSFFVYARIGNLYYGALQTLGRRVETDTWRPDNTDAAFPQPTTASFTSFNGVRNYTSGSLVSLRYISLGYTFKNQLLERFGLNNLQVYTQVLNPIIWGGEAVKVGLNPDDVNGWDSVAGAERGGQTANTILLRSAVFGLRLSL
ncbi:SusC/RagA family TonB-linked outer membrane protein [Sphingobacterium corticibacterium]|uniref:SusC/RagA family TonB-linked outer membrane protein n=1 Tax=Sphingobacterium corticibacterium TaxID=2484746 RepID=A0A4Q6XM66_9SPHI|nr:SusC/RagA family TonB-linked outer membrane protein [Sphingobacterium corticibacterium]RZF58324.1 SusC/RagA family TonB-linked outer membrane protein [Sphingobacterium corticibacterium]